MKKLFITTAVAFFIMFAFFVSRLSAQDEPPLSGKEVTISMDFRDSQLKDLLKVFSIQAGLNFIASESVQDRKITLYLDKVPLGQAMDKIFSANNLTYELDPEANIFVVKEWGRMETETVTQIFYLKYASVSTSSIKDELSKSLAIGVSGVNSSSKSKYHEEGESGITSAVKKLLSAPPVGSLIEDFRTNSLIITDTPMKMKVINQVIKALDVAVPQVLLEVEMLDVSKNAIDKVGFKFGDTPFTAIITGASAAMGFPYGSWGKIISNGAKGLIDINDPLLGGAYDMQLDFIRNLSDTKFLARPKLLTLNNESAEISITKDEVVGRVETPGTQTSAPTVNYTRSTDLALTHEGTGIFLRVTPQVNLDVNEITMVINPKSSASSVSALSTAENPQSDVEVRSTRSIVKVKDGETIVLGGLIHQDSNVTIKKLPILGDIPFVGVLFRHKDQPSGLERELVIFITPHIVRDKTDVKLGQLQNIQLPIREQALAGGGNRDYIINSSMSKFDKTVNGKR